MPLRDINGTRSRDLDSNFTIISLNTRFKVEWVPPTIEIFRLVEIATICEDATILNPHDASI